MAMYKHGSTGYRNGCRCAVCRGAEAKRQRRYRARNPNAQIRGGKVVALPTAAPIAPTIVANHEVEQAVREQCEMLPRAAERPGEVAAAIRLAQLCDDPAYFALLAQNANRLHLILSSLGSPKAKGHKRLSAVIAMTERKRAAQ
jgi:hypothetical protein